MKSFKEILNEIFDKPWSMRFDKHMTEHVKHHIENHKNVDEHIGNIQVHKLEGLNGHLISYTRNHILEAHHISLDGDTGKISHVRDVNPRFISTMIHHLKVNGLDKGRSVRVVAPLNSPLKKHYDKFIKHYATKHNHKTDDEDINSMGSNLHSTLIHPHGYSRTVEEMIKENMTININ